MTSFIDFQKIFPKAKNVLSEAELVKDYVDMYNRKIVEFNAELQMIPERCPLEVSAMCDMISDNKLQAENYTYLVSTTIDIDWYVLTRCLLFYYFRFVSGRIDKCSQGSSRSGKRRTFESTVDVSWKCQHSKSAVRTNGKRKMAWVHEYVIRFSKSGCRVVLRMNPYRSLYRGGFCGFDPPPPSRKLWWVWHTCELNYV